MSESITFIGLDLSGLTGLNLFLRKQDGTLLNTGGDALAESPAGSGRFTGTLAEARTGFGTLAASICNGSETADNCYFTGWLSESSSLVTDTFPSASSGSTGDWTDTEKAQIRNQLNIDGTKTPPTAPAGAAIVIAPGTGNLTTAYLTCLSDALAVQSGVTVSQEFLEPGDSGFAYDGTTLKTFTSANNGVVQMPAAKGATYRFWRGSNKSGGIVVTIPLDADSTLLLPSLVGR